MTDLAQRGRWVGPVLQAGPAASALVAAFRELNPALEVIDRGSYLRVLAPERCVLTRAAAERQLGTSFRLPGDLELVMSSFKGQLALSEEQAEWSLARSEP